MVLYVWNNSCHFKDHLSFNYQICLSNAYFYYPLINGRITVTVNVKVSLFKAWRRIGEEKCRSTHSCVVSGFGYNLQELLLYLYRARNEITQLSIPTNAQVQRHRLKFIINHLKKLLHVSVYDHLQGVYNVLAKITIILTTVGCKLSVVMWQHVVLFVSGYTWRASECTCSS